MPEHQVGDAAVVERQSQADIETALQWSTADTPAARLSNFEKKRMFNTIQQASKSDTRLARLLNEAREYAQIYVLARRRQKGCDGMGELATVKEEFRDVVDELIKYCQEKKYISQNVSYDVDSIADEIVKGQDPL